MRQVKKSAKSLKETPLAAHLYCSGLLEGSLQTMSVGVTDIFLNLSAGGCSLALRCAWPPLEQCSINECWHNSEACFTESSRKSLLRLSSS